jgi:hypothetical protein
VSKQASHVILRWVGLVMCVSAHRMPALAGDAQDHEDHPQADEGSRIGAPAAIATALAITASETHASTRAWSPSAIGLESLTGTPPDAAQWSAQ